MTRITFVSGADANYYPLLREWIHSVRRFPQGAEIDICVLDSGLSTAQRDELKSLTAAVVAPDWPQGLSAQKTRGQDYLKACVCRPFIREIFPGYDIYMWMDPDTWVQDWSAVQMFLDSAIKRPDRIILTNGADRAYGRPVRVSWRGPFCRVKSFYFTNGKKAFGRKIAKALLPHYVLSAGCFALSATALHWERWQQLVRQAAIRGKVFPAEQLSLGKLVHLEDYPAELLPAYTHWLCEHKPLWDAERQLFVEPFMPHMTLGILHLSGVDEMRADRSVTAPFETTAGGMIALNYRYPHYDAGALDVKKPVRA